jgi:hypothetical protein
MDGGNRLLVQEVNVVGVVERKIIIRAVYYLLYTIYRLSKIAANLVRDKGIHTHPVRMEVSGKNELYSFDPSQALHNQGSRVYIKKLHS